MTHNLSFRYHADMTTKGLWSAKVEVHMYSNIFN